MTTININFSVSDNNSGETIYRGIMPIDITDNELQSAAKMVDDNGGYITDLDSLGKLSEHIGDEISYGLSDIEELADIDNWDDFMFDIDKEVPEELIDAVSQYLTKKNVDFTVRCLKDGNVSNVFVNADISPKVFNTMVELAAQPHDGYTDIEYLRQTAEGEYNELMRVLDKCLDSLKTTGDFDSVSLSGEYPYQVYESL